MRMPSSATSGLDQPELAVPAPVEDRQALVGGVAEHEDLVSASV